MRSLPLSSIRRLVASALPAAFLFASGAFAEEIDFKRAHELFERAQRGDQLTPDEKAYIEKAKAAQKGEAASPEAGGIDWNRAKALYQKSQKGETLSPDDQAYLDKAKAIHDRGGAPKAAAGSDIDWDRARSLHQREQKGEPLTPDEQAYLEKAKTALREGRGPGRGGNPGAGGKPAQPGQARALPVPPPRSETGMVPLTDLTAKYKDQDGGLYGENRNEPPPALAAAAKAETAKIQPLGPDGKPSAEGKIVLLSIGMSNTTMEFANFVQLAKSEPSKSPKVEVVDGAQGGQTAVRIADANAPFWGKVDERLQAAGVTPAQVQVVWLKEANGQPSEGFPGAAEKLRDDITSDLQVAKQRYPNLRLAYLSSRIYGGYATTPLNPEPYAYEGAFAVRWVIQAQQKGEPKLNADPEKGAVKAPLVLWGPYLWTDGEKGRQSGDLVWKKEDVGADGTHPSESGRRKVAELLLAFFKSDPNTRTWFLKK